MHVQSRAESCEAGRQGEQFRLGRRKELPVFDNPAIASHLGPGRIPSADVAHALRHG